MQGGGEQCGRNAFAHHVRHHQQHPTSGDLKNIIEISAHMSGAEAKPRQPEARNWRKIPGQERFLNVARDLQFAGSDLQIQFPPLEISIDKLNGKEFGEGADNLHLLRAEGRGAAAATDGHRSKDHFTVTDRTHEPLRPGPPNIDRVIRRKLQRRVVSKSNFSLRQSGSRFD